MSRSLPDIGGSATVPTPGRVVLVGAGPGSLDLLTLKAAGLIAAADWLVHDALVQPEVLALARRARIISVGKRSGRKSTRQREINDTLIDCARRGGLVVRLKGGDPLLFARAREELDALRLAGLDVEVVPGITTAQAAYAALGAPMTERGTRRSIVFATPQVAPEPASPAMGLAAAGAEAAAETGTASAASDAAEPRAREGAGDLQWARALVNAGGGAVYMASTVTGRTRATLLSLGMPADTPATWLVNVSLPSQAVIATTLGALQPLPEGQAGHPALLLLGTAVPSAAHEPASVREPAAAALPS